MSNVEQQARELLAAEIATATLQGDARADMIRTFKWNNLSWFQQAALRAITKALSTRRSMDGVEELVEAVRAAIQLRERCDTSEYNRGFDNGLRAAEDVAVIAIREALASLPLRSDGGGDPEGTRRTALIYARNTMADIAQRNNAEDMVAKWKSGIFDSLPDISSRVDAFLAGVRHTQSAPPPVSDSYRDGVEDAAKVADAYRATKAAIVKATEGDDDAASAACWHAGKIAAAIRSMVVKPSGPKP